jgi:hypothetical protein
MGQPKMQRVAKGMTNKEIAINLKVSEAFSRKQNGRPRTAPPCREDGF